MEPAHPLLRRISPIRVNGVTLRCIISIGGSIAALLILETFACFVVKTEFVRPESSVSRVAFDLLLSCEAPFLWFAHVTLYLGTHDHHGVFNGAPGVHLHDVHADGVMAQ